MENHSVYFAELDSANKVVKIVELKNEDVLNELGEESEEKGISICKSIYGENTNWKKTTIDSQKNGMYARIGHTYDDSLNAFIPIKPFDSWILNKINFEWESPIGPPPKLNEYQMKYNVFYHWDEVGYVSGTSSGWVISESKPQPTTGILN